MKKKRIVRMILAILLLLTAVIVTLVFIYGPGIAERQHNRIANTPAPEIPETVMGLHDRLFIADLHCDMLLWGRNPLKRAEYGHTDLIRLREGNMGLQVFAAVTKVPKDRSYDLSKNDSDALKALAILQRWPIPAWKGLMARALYQAERLRRAEAASGGAFVIIESKKDLDNFLKRREQEPEMMAGVLALEGLHALEKDIRNIDRLFNAGYRMMGLTHFFDNAAAGSAHGVTKGGLTGFGRKAVRRMEALGIAIDLAHASPQACIDVLNMVSRPVVVSHTGVQGTCPGPRNLNDDLLQRIRLNGGVIGVGYWKGAVCGIGEQFIVKGINYAVNAMGIDHVALGSDFDGAVKVPFDSASLHRITNALVNEGYTEDQIKAVMGRNVLNLFKQTLPSD